MANEVQVVPVTQLNKLSDETRALTGCTHEFVFDYTHPDLDSTGVGTDTITIVAAGDAGNCFLTKGILVVDEAFVGTSLDTITLELGRGGSGTPDTDAVFSGKSLAVADLVAGANGAIEVNATQSVIATVRNTGTGSGGAASLTQGKARVLFGLICADDLSGKA